MLLTSHGLQLGRGHHHRVRSDENHIAAGKQEHQVLDVSLILLCPTHTTHGLPEVVIGAQEEDPDHGGLNDKQPGKQPTHQRDAHLLTIGIDLAHEPISGKWQWNQKCHAQRHRDVTHPIIMSSVFIRF